jgi:hypothetical protein
MSGDIQFLSDLEDDLLIAARRELVAGKGKVRRSSPLLMRAVAVVAVMGLAGGIGYATTRGGAGPSPRAAGRAPVGAAARHEVRINAPAGPVPAPSPPSQLDPGLQAPFISGEKELVAGPPNSSASVPAVPAPAGPLIGPKIVKTAKLSLQVKKGTFQGAFGDATQVADRYGGFVESSSTSNTKTGYGTLAIRVPARYFGRALADLRRLGTVSSESIAGQDVTLQYVDLQARIKTWQSQEAALLRLMGQASSLQETLTLQSHLQDVQFRIEELKGQLRVLQDQTANASISVVIREAGAPAPTPTPKSEAVAKPDLANAGDHAVAGFLGVLFAIVVGLGYLVPVTIVALVAWFVYRRVRPRVAV